MKPVTQPQLNTFKRVGIDYDTLSKMEGTVEVNNRFGFGSCETTPLIAHLIAWVYEISNNYEDGDYSVNVSDFDRVRYFILQQDSNAYNVCID